MRLPRLFLALAAATLVLVGCDSEVSPPTEPVSLDTAAQPELATPEWLLEGGQGGFYPLAIGSHWCYRRTITLQDLDAGGNPIGTPTVFSADVETETIGTETLNGRDYVVERETTTDEGDPTPSISWTRFRQDRFGLFVFDTYTCDPPGPETCRETPSLSATATASTLRDRAGDALASRGSSDGERAAYRAAWLDVLAKRDRVLGALRPGPGDIGSGGRPPGGPLDGEYVRLRYPLRRGAEWELRPGEDFDFRYRVVGRELLRLPAGRFPAVRIRVLSETFGPNDRAFGWYGRCGFLRLAVRFVAEVRDPDGVVVGRFLVTESQALEDLSVVGRPGCSR